MFLCLLAYLPLLSAALPCLSNLYIGCPLNNGVNARTTTTDVSMLSLQPHWLTMASLFVAAHLPIGGSGLCPLTMATTQSPSSCHHRGKTHTDSYNK